MIKKNSGIDWDWVKSSLLKKERISPSDKNTIFDTACKSIDKARELVRPEAVFINKAVRSIDVGSITIEGDIQFCGKTLSSFLRGARQVHLFLVTIGPNVEDEASALMKKGESLAGYLLDRTGSFAVESMTDALVSSFRENDTMAGNSVSMPFSPGYCDWPIEEQAKLDSILGFSRIGVHLTESYMMSPRKSISGLFGIGPKGQFSGTRSGCGTCNMKSCGWRNT